jgi:DNA-binding response OmpR family regulator
MAAFSGRVTFRPFELGLEIGRLCKSDRVLKLRPQPMRVLCLLVIQAGKPVSRDEVRRLLWGESTFADYDMGADYCVYRIRSVLGDKAQAPPIAFPVIHAGLGNMEAAFDWPEKALRLRDGYLYARRIVHLTLPASGSPLNWN